MSENRERDLIDAARRKVGAARSSVGHAAVGGPAGLSAPVAGAFPNYDLIREIHRGGQGVVYLARQRSTQRDVAIKVMREGPFAGPRDHIRFQREVELLAALRHPNIVSIHDSGTTAGFFYYVMDYIEGPTLDRWADARAGREAGQRSAVQHGAMHDILRLYAVVCDAVQAAHLRGVIHRDLKPGNVLVDGSGQPHILDFGLARTVGDSQQDGDSVTRTGQFVGSPPWASPEQAEGRRHAVDLRSDVYSLGVMLFQALTGRFPYTVTGTMREVVENILHAVPPRPGTIVRGLDADVDTIILKCLSKEPDRRYQMAGELATDIRRCLAGEPIEARRASTFYVLRRVLRRHRVAAGLLSLLALTVLASSIVLAFLWRSAERQRVLTEEKAEALRRSAYFSTVRQAQSELRDMNLDAATQLLDACPPDLRGWEWRHLVPQLDTCARTLRLTKSTVLPTYSPDGSTLAVGSFDRTVRVLETDSLRVLREFRLAGMVESIAFSPDSRWMLVATRAVEPVLIDLDSDAEPRKLTAHHHWVTHAAWSPDGEALATVSLDRRLYVYDARTGERRLDILHDDGLDCVAFSPDSALVATSSYEGDIAFWRVRDGSIFARRTAHQGRAVHMVFTPDGRQLISTGADNTICFTDPATGMLLHRIVCAPDDVGAIALRADGGRIAVASHQAIREWELDTLDELPPRLGHVEPVAMLDYSPSGDSLASGDRRGALKFWDARCDSRVPRVAAHGRAVRAITTSADGRLLASGGEDNNVTLATLDGQIVSTLVGHRATVRGVCFDAGARRLISVDESGTLNVWDLDDGGRLARRISEQRPTSCVAASRDRKRLALGRAGGDVSIYDVDSLTEIRQLNADGGAIGGIALSEDGSTLAVTPERGGVAVWRLRDAALLLRSNEPRSRGISLSPDGSKLVVQVTEDSMRVVDVASGATLMDIGGHRATIQAVCFSNDGSRILSGETGHLIHVWDAATGCAVIKLRGHRAGVPVLHFSDDGSKLVSGSNDGEILIWSGAEPAARAAP